MRRVSVARSVLSLVRFSSIDSRLAAAISQAPITPKPEGKVRIRFISNATSHIAFAFEDIYTYPDVSLKDVAEGGGIPIVAACGGTCKCSTCHMYILNGTRYGGNDVTGILQNHSITKPIYVPPPEDQELDMLDLAIARDDKTWGGEGTSRLGCQVMVTEEMEGLAVAVATDQVDRRFVRR